MASIVCIKSVHNNKYLRYNNGDGVDHGLLQFSADKPVDSLAQFEVIPSTNADNLIHIKSRYTNMFLVRWGPGYRWITASANKLNEDKTSSSCTLFELSGDPTHCKLKHVQLGDYAQVSDDQKIFKSFFYIPPKDSYSDSSDIFTIISWSSILNLPTNFTFKGVNDKYLGPVLFKGINYLQFSYDDPNDPKVAHESITNKDGTLSIKSKYNGKYWRLGDNNTYIVTDVMDTSDFNIDVMFRVKALDVNVVALLNMFNNRYCKLYTGALENLYSPAVESVDKWTPMQVKDLGE